MGRDDIYPGRNDIYPGRNDIYPGRNDIYPGRLPLHNRAVATDLGRPYWIYIIPTHDMHQ